MRAGKQLQVFYKERRVGTLALTGDHRAAFAYDEEWLKTGFSVNPFSLPLKGQVFVPVKDYFHGLFGVFADSLPDAWGNLLLNRFLRKRGIDPGTLTVLDRLAIVGDSGMGALSYRPEIMLDMADTAPELDELARECKNILRANSGLPGGYGKYVPAHVLQCVCAQPG